jgi:hypothetical protein
MIVRFARFFKVVRVTRVTRFTRVIRVRWGEERENSVGRGGGDGRK